MDVPSHRWLILLLVVAVHALVATILAALSHFPAFDTSADILLDSTWLRPLLRWDAFHLVHIARDGYVNEHEYAFFSGTPIVMRFGAKVLKGLNLFSGNSVSAPLISGVLLSAAVAVDAALALYDLTLLHFRSRSTALLVVVLSLLSQSPQTLRYASYAEPFFAHLSYRGADKLLLILWLGYSFQQGMLFCAQEHYFLAAMAFALASFYRSNGVVLAGYLIWGLLLEPRMCSEHAGRVRFRVTFKTALYCTLLCMAILIPFIEHHYRAYSGFCTLSSSERRPWCTRALPLIYPFVQSEYWDVGFLRYWTLQQSPNLVIASPILILLVYSSVVQIHYSLRPHIQNMLQILRFLKVDCKRTGEDGEEPPSHLFYEPSLIPYAVHSLFLSITCLVSAHTQIILRLASALPFTYWAIVYLLLKPTRLSAQKAQIEFPNEFPQREKLMGFANWWLIYSSLWAAIGLTMWAAFLPPA